MPTQDLSVILKAHEQHGQNIWPKRLEQRLRVDSIMFNRFYSAWPFQKPLTYGDVIISSNIYLSHVSRVKLATNMFWCNCHSVVALTD